MAGTLPKGTYPPPSMAMGPKNPTLMSNHFMNANTNSPSGSLSRPMGTLDSNNSGQTAENTMTSVPIRNRFGSEISSEMQQGNPYQGSPIHQIQSSNASIPPPSGTHRGGMFPLSVGVQQQKWDASQEGSLGGAGGIYGTAMSSQQLESIPMRSMGTLSETGEERRPAVMNSTTALSVASGSVIPSLSGTGTGPLGLNHPPWLTHNSSNAPPASKSVSFLYAMLFALIGLVLLFAKFFSASGMRDLYIDIFAVYMFGFGFVACLYLCVVNFFIRKTTAAMNQQMMGDQQTQLLYSGSNNGDGSNGGLLRDESNGSFYSKAALVLFFVVAFIHLVVSIAEQFTADVDVSCFTILRLVVLVLQILFLSSQLMLTVFFSKDYIVSLSGLARMSISHAIAANAFYWILSLSKETLESLEFSQPGIDKELLINGRRITGDCFRRSLNAISQFEERFSFLFFCFLSSFLLYSTSLLSKMWTNCGKKTSSIRKKLAQQNYDSWVPRDENKRLFTCNFKICEVLCGFGIGFVALFSCVGTVVIDQVLAQTDVPNHSFVLFYHVVVCVVCLAVLGFMLPLATCIIKGHPKRSKGVINWMSQPVIAVTSLATLTYSVFNAMWALFILINGESLAETDGEKNSESDQNKLDSSSAQFEVHLIAACLFSLNVFRTIEVVLQSIYLSDAMKRQVVTSSNGNDNSSGDDDDDLSWAERTSSSRVFVILFLFVNLALAIAEMYEMTNSTVINWQQVQFLGSIKWCLFVHLVGAFVCLYRIHSVVCLLDILRIAF